MKEIFTNKNVLITGAAGFLGSHLCDRCIDYGMNVFGMDNFIFRNRRAYLDWAKKNGNQDGLRLKPQGR